MPPQVRVHLLPSLFQPQDLEGGTAVVIDVLRASTTVVQSLHAGARCVVPCATIDEAQTLAARMPASDRLLGGERDGLTIPGFDLDNSPLKYMPQRVAGRSLFFTTTNGTLALRRAERAARVGMGAFVNISAVEAWARRSDGPVHLVCAGTDGQITAEDVLFAGLLAMRLLPAHDTPDASTEMAVLFAQRHGRTSEELLAALRRSRGGANLLHLGFGPDIEFAARCDALPVVPVWDPLRRELHAEFPA